MSPPAWTIRGLTVADASDFHALRLAGFRAEPGAFRIAPEDEQALSLETVAERLAREYVVGGFRGGELVGIGGLTRFGGARLRHRALLWGMYVHPSARGTGLAGGIVDALLAEADREGVASVLLTVVAGNAPAERLYRSRGFRLYGTEPAAIRTVEGDLDECLMCRQRPT